MAAVDGAVRHFALHMERLGEGCRRLGLDVPDTAAIAREIAASLPARGRRVVKLIVTRGPGERGYRPPARPKPTRILGIVPWPDYPAANYTAGIELHSLSLRLGLNPALAGLKHLGRLEHVLAQMELARLGAQEGLLLDIEDRVVGGTTSNVFILRGGELLTPDLSRCGVRGIMRRLVLEAAPSAGLATREADLDLDALHDADEIFVTNAVFGIWPVRGYDGTLLKPGPRTRQLQSMLGIEDA